MSAVLLSLEDVTTYYGPMRILEGISLHLGQGELVCLLGGNASGKSTTMKTVLGLVRPNPGTITFRGEQIHELRTSEIVKRGIAPVPEARRVFPRMTVLENLEMGRYTRRREPGWETELDRVFGLFPILAERRHQKAGTLSGGQQQMVAIGRGLMAAPRCLMLDEPSLGLAPIMVDTLADTIVSLHESGLTILLVEQRVDLALRLADRGYVMETGRIVLEDKAAALLADERVREAYLGA